MAQLKITQTKSTIKQPFKQKRTMEALGLRRMGQSNTLEDSPQLRGMIEKVRHLVSIEEA
jgi:large subunit ribosomal protein L30